MKNDEYKEIKFFKDMTFKEKINHIIESTTKNTTYGLWGTSLAFFLLASYMYYSAYSIRSDQEIFMLLAKILLVFCVIFLVSAIIGTIFLKIQKKK